MSGTSPAEIQATTNESLTYDYQEEKEVKIISNRKKDLLVVPAAAVDGVIIAAVC